MTRLDQSRQYHENRKQNIQLSAGEREYSEVALGQIRAKIENMESSTMYAPEVNAEAIAGTRILEPGKVGSFQHTTKAANLGAVQIDRRPGMASMGEGLKNTVPQMAGAKSAYDEEHVSRGGGIDQDTLNRLRNPEDH
jgi:hypothetical protein